MRSLPVATVHILMKRSVISCFPKDFISCLAGSLFALSIFFSSPVLAAPLQSQFLAADANAAAVLAGGNLQEAVPQILPID